MVRVRKDQSIRGSTGDGGIRGIQVGKKQWHGTIDHTYCMLVSDCRVSMSYRTTTSAHKLVHVKRKQFTLRRPLIVLMLSACINNKAQLSPCL